MPINFPSKRRRLAAFLRVGLVMQSSPSCAQEVASFTGTQCKVVVRADFSQLEEAPGKVMTATIVEGTGNLPGYCEVTGFVWRDVRFRAQQPMTRASSGVSSTLRLI